MKALNMNAPQKTLSSRPASRGISLIIVLIMLVIIGITAASSMRSATSEQRTTNSLRMEGTAQQYAEAALRYCEKEIQKTPANTRVATLQNIPTTTFALSGWEDTLTWTTAGGRAGSTRTPLPTSTVSDANTVAPSRVPECVAEWQSTPGTPTFYMTVITARGFSSDYASDGSGNTTKGAVVWLQSIVNTQ